MEKIIRQVGRSLHDTVIHYGDGRIILFLRDTPKSGAASVQERIVSALAPYGEVCPFMVSTVCCPEDAENPDALVVAVDNLIEELAYG